MLIKSEPAILYFGTPVVLISTVNEDGSYNVALMSSAFWLGWRCMLGLASVSQTTKNMLRTKECFRCRLAQRTIHPTSTHLSMECS